MVHYIRYCYYFSAKIFYLKNDLENFYFLQDILKVLIGILAITTKICTGGGFTLARAINDGFGFKMIKLCYYS